MSALKERPTKKQLRRFPKRRLPAVTMTRYDSKGIKHFAYMLPRATYSRMPSLKNGNGSKYDPVACDAKKGHRQ